MKNGDNSAMPIFSQDFGYISEGSTGLTKREYFAAMAMQGLLASNLVFEKGACAKNAVRYANELLEALEK